MNHRDETAKIFTRFGIFAHEPLFNAIASALEAAHSQGVKDGAGFFGNPLITVIRRGEHGEVQIAPIEGHIITPDGVVRKVRNSQTNTDNPIYIYGTAMFLGETVMVLEAAESALARAGEGG